MLSAHKTWFKIILLLKVTSYVLSGPSWPPPPCGLPHSTKLSFSPLICRGTVATRQHNGGLITGVVCNWKEVGHLVLAASLPVVAFGRKEGGTQNSIHV